MSISFFSGSVYFCCLDKVVSAGISAAVGLTLLVMQCPVGGILGDCVSIQPLFKLLSISFKIHL